MRILLAEDDLFSGELLARQLAKEGYHINWVKNGNDAIREQMEDRYDVLLLDWMLPGCTGVEACQNLREQGDLVPIIMLTSRDAVNDRVVGLEYGADDYICKPCIFQELLARMKRVVERAGGIEGNKGQAKVEYHQDKRAVIAGEKVIHLSKKEAILYELLLAGGGQPVSRERLAAIIWQEKPGSTDALDPLVNQLRRRLSSLAICNVENVRGSGYILRFEGRTYENITG